MFKPNNKGQSILEYAILLGVILIAILIMQIFIKRGYQGGLKDAAEKMGDAYSASSTTIFHNRSMGVGEVQHITEETATNRTMMRRFVPTLDVKGTVTDKAYSYQKREGGNTTSETKSITGNLTGEGIRWEDYNATSVPAPGKLW